MSRWWWIIVLWTTILPQQGFDGVGDFFIEAQVNNTAPYMGEQITYTLRYYAISQEGIALQFPDFEGFWIGESRTTVSGVQIINDRQFFVTEIQIDLAPLVQGDIGINPAQLVVAGDVFRSEQVISTQRITMTVRPLPEGAPTAFSGDVGDFVISANFDAPLLTLGNPFVFEINIQGVGILERIALPTLNFPSEWRILPQLPRYTQASIGVPLGNKKFQWLVIPNAVGVYPIPPIEWAYFDPRTEIYVALSTPTFTLEILPTITGETRLAPITSSPSGAKLSLKLLASTTGIGNLGMLRLAWGIMPIIGLILFIVTIRQKRQTARLAKKRYRTALSRAKKRLKSLGSTPSSAKVTTIIMAYIADKQNVPHKEVVSALHDYLPDHLAVHTESALAIINSTGYIPQTVEFNFSEVLDEALRLLTVLEAGWKK